MKIAYGAGDAALEDGKWTFSTTVAAAIADGHRFYIVFPEGKVNAKDYPYFVIELTMTGTAGSKVDIDTTTSASRMWGRKFEKPNGKVFVDADGYTGGANGGYGSTTAADTYKMLEIRLGVTGDTPSANAKVVVGNVAFFAKKADAEAYAK